MTIKEAMEKLDPYNPKTQVTIDQYCLKGQIPAKRKEDKWYIDDEYINSAIDWRKQVKSVDEIIDTIPEFSEIHQDDLYWLLRNIARQTENYLIDSNEYSMLFSGRFITKVQEVTELIRMIIRQYIDRRTMIPVAKAARSMGLSTYQLKKRLHSGEIPGHLIVNEWYLSADTVKNYLDIKSQYVGIYDLVKEITALTSTLFDPENQTHRAMMNAWIRNSKLYPLVVLWEDTEFRGDRRNSFYLPVNAKADFVSVLTPFLRHYGLSANKEEMLKTSPFWESHPKTKAALIAFSQSKTGNGMAALMETLIECLDCEIMDADNEVVGHLVTYACGALTEIYQNYLAMFLKYVSQHYSVKYDVVVDYHSGKRKNHTNTVVPYTEQQYFAFAYMNFNDDFIAEHDLVRKAVERLQCALLWLRSIWHYVGMWRIGDIESTIPVIDLHMTGRQLKERILSGDFYKYDAEKVSLLLQTAIIAGEKPPHKTGKELLRIYFPESLRPIIGLAYACCLLHQQDDDRYITWKRINLGHYKEFYGDRYIQIFGNSTFSNRRANKSFADALVTITELDSDACNKVLGYTVASFARGHAQTPGKIPVMTHRYLQYKLEGFSDNEILKRLLEIGPCSFTVSMLIEAVYGEKYSKLPFTMQADFIKATGLSAFDVENISDIVLRSTMASKAYVNELLASFPCKEASDRACKKAMINIVTGKARSKSEGIHCLDIAFMHPCRTPHCDNCVGCESAIMTKGALFVVLDVLRKAYEKLHEAKTPASHNKYRTLINKKYLPAVAELFLTLKHDYDIDITEMAEDFRKIMEEHDDLDRDTH